MEVKLPWNEGKFWQLLPWMQNRDLTHGQDPRDIARMVMIIYHLVIVNI